MALTRPDADIFKQPVTIVGAIAVLLLMDWKFTVVTLILFPTCLLPQLLWRRARKACEVQFLRHGRNGSNDAGNVPLVFE